VLVIAAPEHVVASALEADLQAVSRELELEALLLSPIEGVERAREASHLVTVYGADHPGIVHAVAAAVAARGVDITDLQTRLADASGEPLYVLMMEVALPAEVEPSTLERELRDAAREQGVELTLRELEADAL
jgi:glycine cleavage system transcriptional repressor